MEKKENQIYFADKYIIEDNGVNFTFKKNGLRHREDGPAVVWGSSEKLCLTNEEKELYKFQKIKLEKKDTVFLIEMIKVSNITELIYFLDDNLHTEEEFNAIKNRKQLNNELKEELPLVNSNTKKLKV